MYGPPRNVQAARKDDEVTITWDQVEMTADDDRGYLIEAFVCQDGAYLWWTNSYPDQYETSYTRTKPDAMRLHGAGCTQSKNTAFPSRLKFHGLRHNFTKNQKLPLASGSFIFYICLLDDPSFF